MTFQISALAATPFAPLFELSDEDLALAGGVRVVADESPGFPCRVSLTDAAAGETLVLVNHRHLDMPSPYAASHAVYVREGAVQAHPAPGAVPDAIARRLLSVRAYDARGFMRTAEVVEGTALAPLLEAMLAEAEVDFVDIHNARQGCFAARARRSVA